MAELSLTDCATASAGSTTLTSSTGGFTAAMVGKYYKYFCGTNITAGFYEITGYTDTNTVTIDRAHLMMVFGTVLVAQLEKWVVL